MLKHAFWLALAIAVGLAVAKMFGGSFNLSTLFGGTSSSSSTAPCHLAAVAFEEDFEEGPRVRKVRRYLSEKFENAGVGQRALMRIYREHGLALASRVRESRFLTFANGLLFRAVLRRAEAF